MTILDLFAGLGGFTEGCKRAGVPVRWAANHWPLSVDYHCLNHPETIHACENAHRVNWAEVRNLIGQVDIAATSPCCQGHGHTRGKERPWHDESRGTAWAVPEMAQQLKPQVILIENVPGFKLWPLYPAWRHALELLGYSIVEHILDAADFSVPQHRVRYVAVATLSKHPLNLNFQAQRSEHRAAFEVISWDAYTWSPIQKPGRAPATLARLDRGRSVFGDRFLAPYYGSGSGLTGRSLSRPIGTITTRARWAVVDGDRMRMLHSREAARAQAFPSSYILPNNEKLANHLVGNAVPPPFAEAIIRAVLEAA